MNLWYFKNIGYIYFKRRMPTCYLLSSKFILTASIILLIYFLTMDIILYNKAKYRGPFQTYVKISNNIGEVKSDILDTIRLERVVKQSLNNKTNNINNNNNKFLRNDDYLSYPKDDLIQQLMPSETPTSRKTLNNFNKNQNSHQSGSIFWPLPVKKIMMADATHYIRSPIAEFVEYGFGFSEIFPFISANLISLTHCVLSVVSIRFLTHDSLFWRQFGVCLFQFRNFLDSFDGVIYRSHAKRMTYKSHYGSMGYFVDAFSDVFGGLCLIGSIAIYFIKHPPPHKKLTRCFRIAADNFDSNEESKCQLSPSSSFSSSSSSSSIINEKPQFHQLNSSSSSSYYNNINNTSSTTTNNNNNNNNNNTMFNFPNYTSSSSSSNTSSSSQSHSQSHHSYYYSQLTKNFHCDNNMNKSSIHKETNYNNSIFATKAVVLASIGLLGIRLALSALFWDRSVHTYEDLLDSMPKSELHQQLQVYVLRSTITLSIMFAWRFLCALSLQDLILTSIFIDKTWEFIVKSQYIGWILLICLIILTELHVAEIRSILSQAI